MMIEMTLKIIAIHGEGDQTTVNALQSHRNKMEVNRLQSANADVPDALMAEPDEAPDVLVVLRDEAHDFRMEWPVRTWNEVEEWKRIAGWDDDKRHWQHGATIKVTVGV